MPFPSGANTGFAAPQISPTDSGLISAETGLTVNSAPRKPMVMMFSEAKTMRLPSGLQLGSACCPGGLRGWVSCWRFEPSAPTIQMVDSPSPGQSAGASEEGSYDRKASCVPSGDHAGLEPKAL